MLRNISSLAGIFLNNFFEPDLYLTYQRIMIAGYVDALMSFNWFYSILLTFFNSNQFNYVLCVLENFLEVSELIVVLVVAERTFQI